MAEGKEIKVKVTISPKASLTTRWLLVGAMFLLLAAVMLAFPEQWLP